MSGERGDAIRECFDFHTPGGEARRKRIENEVRNVVEREACKYSAV